MPGPILPPRANDPRIQSLLGTATGVALVSIDMDVRNALATQLGIDPDLLNINDAWARYAAANSLDPNNPSDAFDYSGV